MLRLTLLGWLTFVLHALPLVRVSAQWVSAELPGTPINVRHIYANATRDTIYFCGALPLTQLGWQQSNAVMRYANGGWDTLGVLSNYVNSVVMYHDTLIAGGFFITASGSPCSGIAYYAHDAWHPYGDLEAGVRMLRVLDDELYAVGTFDTADGLPASGIAKRSGNSWQPIGLIDGFSGILDVIKYNGALVVTGSLQMDEGDDIAIWNGQEWNVLGPGIVNPMSGGQCLAVYQGDLYVGGQIALEPGNPGQNIMRWDGSQFQALGQGIQQELGDTVGIATVWEMVEHDGLLFVGGGFRAAGGILADGLATWDGTEWCAVPGDFTSANGADAMDFYYDTLFVGTGVVLDGDTVNRAAKFIGQEYQAACSGPVGVQDQFAEPVWSVFPNPGHEWITVQSPSALPHSLRVMDAIGRVLFSRDEVRSQLSIETNAWATGVYSITFEGPNGKRSTQRWLKE